MDKMVKTIKRKGIIHTVIAEDKAWYTALTPNNMKVLLKKRK